MNEKEKKTPKATIRSLKKSIEGLKVNEKCDLDQDLHSNKTNNNLKKRVPDHYHGNQHFDKSGQVDYIHEDEFKISTHFKLTRRNLTYKIAASGIFLALSVAVSALDILFESFMQVPIGQVYISFRFLDIVILLLGVPILGPAFASLVGFLEPVFHNLIHGMAHGWIQPLTDAITNPLIIFITWFVFYIIFHNSPYHRDPNNKKDWFKRLVPTAILLVVISLIATLSFILALYIQDKVSGTSIVDHPEHHHDHNDLNWDIFSSNFAKMFFAIFGIQVLRYFLALGAFVLFEGKMRPINHRYR